MPSIALHLLLVASVLLFLSDQAFSLMVNTAPIGSSFNPFDADDFVVLQRLLSSLPQVSAAEVLGNGSSGCGKQPSFTPGQITNVQLGGGRTALVYVPTSYASRTTPVALQVLFHGLNDNCRNFITATAFMAYAEREGYIIASGCGSVGLLGVGWNAGTCCGFPSENTPNDIKYATSIVDVVSAGACVDPNKVMAVGFSNGAMLSEVLACERAHIFRAVASVAGVVEIRPGNDEGLGKCDEDVKGTPGGNRSSVLMVHGYLDPLVPIGGNSILGFPAMAANVERWAKRNGCTKPPVSTLTAIGFSNTLYNGCDVSAPPSVMKTYNAVVNGVSRGTGGGSSIVEVVYNQFGAHTWPSGVGFSTTDYIYKFGLRVFSSY